MNGSASFGASAAATLDTPSSATTSRDRMREAYLVTHYRVAMKRRFRNRFRLQIAVLVTLFQLPAVLWLCAATHGVLPLGIAAALSLPYLRQLHSPWSSEARRLPMYLALAWWASCIVFAFLFPIAWLAGK